MDDDEYYSSLIDDSKWSYHDICLWLPHCTETVSEIAKDMKVNGFRVDRSIVVYEGKILDGRHRYEGALEANVDPLFTEFKGTREEAIGYVTSENVARRHLSSKDKQFFYVQLAEALGVQSRGGSGNNQYQSGNVSNDTLAPSQADHADSLGVSRPTIARWEVERKEIKEDPVLSKLIDTPQGFREAREAIRDRKQKEMEERPNNFDLNKHVKSTEHCTVGVSATNLVVAMEQLVSKFDERDIKMYLHKALKEDVINIKIPALHKMADILKDLCEDLPLKQTDYLNLN